MAKTLDDHRKDFLKEDINILSCNCKELICSRFAILKYWLEKYNHER